MDVYRLLGSDSFDPEAVAAMTAAYDGSLADLRMADSTHPLAELLAKAIITIASTGERSPDKIKERALNVLGVRKIDAA